MRISDWSSDVCSSDLHDDPMRLEQCVEIDIDALISLSALLSRISGRRVWIPARLRQSTQPGRHDEERRRGHPLAPGHQLDKPALAAERRLGAFLGGDRTNTTGGVMLEEDVLGKAGD